MTKFIQYDKVTSEQKEAGVMLITRESDYALRLLRTLRDGEQYSVGELAGGRWCPSPLPTKSSRSSRQPVWCRYPGGLRRLPADGGLDSRPRCTTCCAPWRKTATLAPAWRRNMPAPGGPRMAAARSTQGWGKSSAAWMRSCMRTAWRSFWHEGGAPCLLR